MKFESKPVEVEAMQWNGESDSLTALLGWIMSDRVNEHYDGAPSITYTQRWNAHVQGEVRAEMSGHRWSLYLNPGDWVIKIDGGVHALTNERFHELYKQKRSRR